MNQFRRSVLIKRVSRWLVPVMLWPLLGYFAPPAKAAETITAGEVARIPAVIVLDFENRSSYDGSIVGRSAAAAVAQEMISSDRWDVLSTSIVNQTLASQKLTLPLDIPGMIQVGQAAEADAIILGQVYAVNLSQSPPRAQVGLRVEMRDVASGELINGAVVTADSGPRPGFRGDNQLLVDEAMRKAAFQVVQDMTRNRLPRGTVLNTQVTGDNVREVLVNIGQRQGVKEGMELIVTRGGIEVSRLAVTRVEADQSITRMIRDLRGAQPEDSVQAIFDMPTVSELQRSVSSDGTLQGAPEAKRRSSGSFNKALLGLMGAALLVFALSGGSKSGRLTGAFDNRPTAEASSLFQGAPISSNPAIKVAWRVPNMVRLQDIIEFQIFRVGGPGVPTDPDAGEIPPGTPVGTVPPGQNFFYDTTQDRDVTFIDLPPGSFPGGTPSDTLTETTVTGVPGIIEGAVYTYQVVMIYRRFQSTPGGGTTDPGGGTGGGTGGTEETLYLQTPVVLTGRATAINPPTAAAPQNDAIINPQSVIFSIDGVEGANQYMIEMSPDPTFKTNLKQVKLPVVPASGEGGSVTATIDVTRLFPNHQGRIYWHAGARNSFDTPGPEPGIWGNLPGDRRWVYSQLESFIIQ